MDQPPTMTQCENVHLLRAFEKSFQTPSHYKTRPFDIFIEFEPAVGRLAGKQEVPVRAIAHCLSYETVLPRLTRIVGACVSHFAMLRSCSTAGATLFIIGPVQVTFPGM